MIFAVHGVPLCTGKPKRLCALNAYRVLCVRFAKSMVIQISTNGDCNRYRKLTLTNKNDLPFSVLFALTYTSTNGQRFDAGGCCAFALATIIPAALWQYTVCITAYLRFEVKVIVRSCYYCPFHLFGLGTAAFTQC